MGFRVKTGPRPGLVIGAGIAKGAEKFVSTFLGVKKANIAAEQNRQRLQSQLQLNKLRAQKLQKDLQPLVFEKQKLDFMSQVSQNRPEFEKQTEKQRQVVADMINSPERLKAAKALASREAALSGNIPLSPFTGKVFLEQERARTQAQLFGARAKIKETADQRRERIAREKEERTAGRAAGVRQEARGEKLSDKFEVVVGNFQDKLAGFKGQRQLRAIEAREDLERSLALVGTNMAGGLNAAQQFLAKSANGGRPSKEDYDNVSATKDIIGRFKRTMSALTKNAADKGAQQDMRKILNALLGAQEKFSSEINRQLFKQFKQRAALLGEKNLTDRRIKELLVPPSGGGQTNVRLKVPKQSLTPAQVTAVNAALQKGATIQQIEQKLNRKFSADERKLIGK